MKRIAGILGLILTGLLIAVGALLLVCEDRPEQQTAQATAAPTPAPVTPSPVPTTVFSATPYVDPAVPTFTPEVTFVPIPTETIPAMTGGRTPTPTPPWATPYPSPEGTATVENASSVRLATVCNAEKGIAVRKKSPYRGGTLGKPTDGLQFAVTGETEEGYEILYQGMTGYIPRENVEISTVSLPGQTDTQVFRAATLNVHGVSNTGRLRKLAAAIREADLDVVGIQEVDKNTDRSGMKDWTYELAKAAGYAYYSFSSATRYEGGDFGTAILSRYPIIEAHTWKLDVYPGKESRSLGFARLLLPTGTAYVFNTHLDASKVSYKSVNIASLAFQLAASGLDAADVGYIVMGDFNCSPPRLRRYLPEIYYANMTLDTFSQEGSTYPKIIDNILYSDGLVAADVHLVDTKGAGATDHRMLVGTFYDPKETE